jgi:hypothetical protein
LPLLDQGSATSTCTAFNKLFAVKKLFAGFVGVPLNLELHHKLRATNSALSRLGFCVLIATWWHNIMPVWIARLGGGLWLQVLTFFGLKPNVRLDYLFNRSGLLNLSGEFAWWKLEATMHWFGTKQSRPYL